MCMCIYIYMVYMVYIYIYIYMWLYSISYFKNSKIQHAVRGLNDLDEVVSFSATCQIFYLTAMNVF